MIFHNKILLVLIGCLVAVPCFGDSCVCTTCTHGIDCICECSEEDVPCPSTGQPGCTKIVETVSKKYICDDEHYVSECGGTDFGFENVLAIWTNQQYRFSPKCWAVDGSLTTAQHYQNMRALFAFEEENIDNRIANMDENSKKLDGCKEATSEHALTAWLTVLSTSCLQQAVWGTAGLSYVCKKCPDGGETGDYTMLKYQTTTIIDSFGNVVNQNIVADTGKWLKFNTIANCYITKGEDKRGSFNLGNGSTDKCYYSKE